MCGRYADFRAAADLADAFAIDDILDDAAERDPSWNVAPTDPVRMIVERPDRATGEIRRSLRVARWGLVAPWAKQPKAGQINARRESITTRQVFAPALSQRRCLIVADGYYEWRHVGRERLPYFVTAKEQWAFAGLYGFWRDHSKPDDDPARWLTTATIVTAPADDNLAWLHDRQPVMLTQSTIDTWLDPTMTDPEAAAALLALTGPSRTATAVSTQVNSVKVNHSGLIDPVERPGDGRVPL